ncbi:LOW QUALITY PROTEIN: coiled-coil domain-containing protein 150 [Mergus octosetaceus]
MEHLAAWAYEQYANQQIQQVLAELTDSRNKLSCDKGELQMANLQRQLEAAKDNNSKVIMMLEHVLASHSKMQAVLDAVQTELGHKDTEISNCRKDRSQSQQKIQMLETELEHHKAKLVAMERQHGSQLEPLSKALEVARMDKKTLALRLEEVQHANNVLQSKLIHTQYDLKSKEAEHQQLMACRVILLKKALQGSSSKFVAVSHANRDLRQKTIELEKTSSSYREKLKSQRAQVKCCLVTKANAGRIKEIETELREIEAIKEEYQKKNYEQSQHIHFVSELKSLRSEMQILLENQHKVQVQNRQLETQLEVERRRVHQLENERQILEKTTQHLKKCKEEIEKLKQASMVSEQVSGEEGAEKAARASPLHLPREQDEHPTPPAQQQEGLRELGRK